MGILILLLNYLITSDAIFHKSHIRKYIFSIWGYGKLELKDDDKIEVGLVEIKPLDVNFTQIFENI